MADIKAMTRELYDRVFNHGDLSAIDRLVAADAVEHTPIPGMPPGAEGVKQITTMYRKAFPDLHIEAEEIVVEGDLVAARVTLTGTHQGEFMGIAPTGRSVRMVGMDMMRVKDGKFVEHWGVEDALGMMQQLGAIPS